MSDSPANERPVQLDLRDVDVIIRWAANASPTTKCRAT
jgi:hypothetical protein